MWMLWIENINLSLSLPVSCPGDMCSRDRCDSPAVQAAPRWFPSWCPACPPAWTPACWRCRVEVRAHTPAPCSPDTPLQPGEQAAKPRKQFYQLPCRIYSRMCHPVTRAPPFWKSLSNWISVFISMFRPLYADWLKSHFLQVDWLLLSSLGVALLVLLSLVFCSSFLNLSWKRWNGNIPRNIYVTGHFKEV